MNDLKMVLNPSLYVFVAEIESLIAEGYSVDFESNPPCSWGLCFEVGMIKKSDAGAELFAGAVADTITVLPIIPQPTPETRNKGGRPRKA